MPTTAVTATAGIEVRPKRRRGSAGSRANARAARIATAGAIGSRYWKPFTGQSAKNATGTRIHESSNVSRQLRSRRMMSRPAIAAASTMKPSAAGTVER